jgi:hypothetical protein
VPYLDRNRDRWFVVVGERGHQHLGELVPGMPILALKTKLHGSPIMVRHDSRRSAWGTEEAPFKGSDIIPWLCHIWKDPELLRDIELGRELGVIGTPDGTTSPVVPSVVANRGKALKVHRVEPRGESLDGVLSGILARTSSKPNNNGNGKH